jgi:gluconolactonase
MTSAGTSCVRTTSSKAATWCTRCLRVGESRQLDPDEVGGSTNPGGKLNPRIGQPPEFVPVKRELPTNVYRWDASGKLEVVVTEEQVPDPNGILFSPDHKKLYVIGTGKGPATPVPAARA